MLVFGGSNSGAGSGASSASQYQISKSLRFQSGNSAYLSRTPAVAGNRKTWTWSGWFKPAIKALDQYFFSAGTVSTSCTGLYITSSGALQFFNNISGAATGSITTNAIFRDPAAWYHVQAVFDTDNATAADRMRIWVNGVRQTVTINTAVVLGTTSFVNASTPHAIGKPAWSASNYIDGYLADVHFIDGQALDPTSFGQTDATTGQWVAKAYTGTYGNNGFKLDFSNNSAAAALGFDVSPASLRVIPALKGDTTLSATQAKFGDSSAYFDGTGDYLTVPHGSNLSLGNGDFTIELWVRPQDITSLGVLVSKRASSSAVSPFHILKDGSSIRFYSSSNGTSWDISSGQTFGTIAANNWYHVAVSRQGNTFRLFLNGVLGATFSSSATLVASTNFVNIGGDTNNYYFNGHIDDLRIYKGVAKYTAAFTPSNSAMAIGTSDPNWGYCSLALPMDKNSHWDLLPSTVAQSTSGWTASSNGGTAYAIGSTISGSMTADATGTYASSYGSGGTWYGPQSVYPLPSSVSGNFSFKCSFSVSSIWSQTGKMALSFLDSANNPLFSLAYLKTAVAVGDVPVYISVDGGGFTNIVGSAADPATWQITRTGNVYEVYMNGTSVGTINGSTADISKVSLSFASNGTPITVKLKSAEFNTVGGYFPVSFDTSGFSVTAGATNDSLTDVPTAYDDGSNGRGNYSTWNPVYNIPATFSAGNLTATTSASAARALSSIPVSSGKWYCEIVYANNGVFGISDGTFLNSYLGAADGSKSVGFHTSTSAVNTYVNGSFLGGVSTTIAVGDIIGLALDAENKIIYFYRNGTQITSYNYSALGWQRAVFAVGHTTSLNYVANFGQRPFAYTPPTGFKALNTQNLTAPTIAKPSVGFDTVLYTGTGAALTPSSGLSFSPDFVWIKGRSAASSVHALYDTVRGAQARLQIESAGIEQTSDGGLTAFNSAGFSLGTLSAVNTNGATYVGWCWDGGSETVTNNNGSRSAQVRANPSTGFSVVTFTDPGSGTYTVGHGLNAAPQLIFVKQRGGGSTSWAVYHAAVGAAKYLKVDTSSAFSSTTVWNNTSPTSSVFSGTTGNALNSGQAGVAYCFAPVHGYSSFGSYTGNGNADGPFIYTGFRPAFVMIKCSSTTGSWVMVDDKRQTYNTNGKIILANSANQESTAAYVDFLSNGFKIRNSAGDVNTNAATYVYAAFASAPFKYSNAY